jgi:hypothetical protein
MNFVNFYYIKLFLFQKALKLIVLEIYLKEKFYLIRFYFVYLE